MNVALLADFGSTFTKVLAVDLDAAVIAGRGQCPSGGDLMDGYDEAAGAALGQVRGPATVALELAASSAGGGLRMAAVGLAAELTALAAQTAALNAGARLLAVLAGRLTGADAARLAALAPEIVLFAGGTDDGQQQRVLDNAAAIAGSLAGAHVVVACNRARRRSRWCPTCCPSWVRPGPGRPGRRSVGCSCGTCSPGSGCPRHRGSRRWSGWPPRTRCCGPRCCARRRPEAPGKVPGR